LNRKILSFIFGSLLVFSLFGAMEFQEVSAASMAVNITTNANSYTEPYFNSTSMPMRLKFTIIVTGTVTPTNWTNLVIQSPPGIVLASEGLQPAASGFSIDYAASNADGVTPGTHMDYTCSIASAGTYIIYLDLVSCPGGPGTYTWTVTPTGGGLAPTSPAVIADNTAPTFTVSYSKTPNVPGNPVTNPGTFGTGNLVINITASEPVLSTPTVVVQQPNLAAKTLVYTTASTTPPAAGYFRTQSLTFPDSVMVGSYTIASTNGLNDGISTVTINARDRAGNIGTAIAAASTGLDGPNFIVDSQVNKPTLSSPDDGFSTTSNTVTFSWDKITEAANNPVTYTLQYSQSSTFASGITTVSGPFNDIPTPSLFLGGGTGWSAGPGGLINYQATGLAMGTWYWRVAATDSLGNTVTLSTLTPRSLTVTSTDSTPPNFRVRYLKSPFIDYNTTPDIVGDGSLQIKVYCSETLKVAPTVKVKPHNQTTWTTCSVTPSGSASIYTATYTVPTSNTYNGLALLSIQGQDVAGNVGIDINAAAWSASRNAAGSPWLPNESDSDGGSFYIDTACDAPSLYNPQNGHVLPFNRNEANYTFYKVSDLSTERPADAGQNNCITYTIQYSTSPTFSSNVITESIDVNESFSNGENAIFCGQPATYAYNKWFIRWSWKPTGPAFFNLRLHISQALSNGTWYWRAWATDRLGNQSPYSETRTFSVSTVTPNLYAPADLSLLTRNNPVLQWKDVCSSTWYNIRLSRGSTDFLDYTLYPDKIAVNTFLKANDAIAGNFITEGSTNVWLIDYNVSTSTPPNPAIGHLEDGVWYWKVASNLDSTAYSSTWRFTVDSTGPPAPTLSLPGNGEVSQNKRPSFSWTAVNDINNLSDPVRYYIQISGNPTFPNAPGPANSTFIGTNTWPSTSIYNPDWINNTYQKGPLTVNNFTPSSDFPETPETNSSAYYWRVYAVDSAGNQGPNSLIHVLKIDTTPPLKWGSDPDGNDSCEDYPGGCETTTAQTDYLALQLRSPSNGIIIQSRNPTLEWRHSVCPCVKNQVSSYIVQYSTDITFPVGKTTETAGVFQVTGISYEESLINMGYTIQNSLYNGTYFWRVSAVDTAGNRTQFTAPWSFTVNIPGNESTPECSSTVPCGTGYTCQSGVCVPITYSAGNLTITVQNSSGTAISGATVTVDGTAQTTDATGKVTFASLSGGAHTINNVTASGYVDSGTSTVIVNGATAHTVTMTVPGTEGYIWGTVYFDQIGTPAPNIQIDIYNQSTDVKVFSGLTNSEGKYQSTALPGSGTYYLKIDSYEKELRNLTPTSLTTGAQDIILQTKGSVNGIVQDDSGQIVTGATVVLKKYSGDVFVDTKTTDRLGQFTFEALPGTYYITISKAGYDAYTSSSFTVPPSQSVNLQSVLGNIVLNALKGTLTVSVKNEAGSVINTATINIKTSGGSLVKSVSTVNGTASTQLAPGAYRVSAVSSGYAESLQQTTNITSNQTSSLSFSLAPATGSIRVVAKDSSGAPLGGASVYLDGELSGITDENGELLLTGLKLGTHTVRITKGGYTAVEEQATAGESTSVVDTVLPKSNLMLYIGAGIGLLIVAGLLYMKFGKPQGPRRPPSSGGLALQGRPGAPKLRPHRHKGGLPPSSIRVKKKNL